MISQERKSTVDPDARVFTGNAWNTEVLTDYCRYVRDGAHARIVTVLLKESV
jgi:hypothetical protein